MRITTINYRHTYNIGNYSSESIGFEATVDEREDEQQALATLKQLAHKFHLESNKELYAPIETVADSPAVPVQQVSALDNDVRFDLIHAISTCTEIKVLETYRLMVKNDKQAQEVYQSQLNKLSNEQGS